MKTQFLTKEKTFILFPVGHLAAIESKPFAMELSKMPEDTEKVIIDMKEVDYISSSCLRVLLVTRQKFSDNSCVKIINCNSVVYEVIKTTAFNNVVDVDICETEFDGKLDIAVEDKAFDLNNASFKSLLAYRAKNNADDLFITYSGKSYSWKDIDVYSQIIAHDLSLKGVKELSHVAIIGTNSANYIFTFFALQKLGAIAVLINDKLTAEEISLQFDIGDVSSTCIGNIPEDKKNDIAKVMSSKSDSSFVYDISDEIVFSSRSAEYQGISEQFSNVVLPDNPAFMIFSSGSTGRPKAVLLCASNMMCDVISQMKRWNINESDSLCLAIPLFHIFAFKTGFVYSAIMNNHIFLTENTRTTTIIDTIEKHGCTLFHAVPTLLLAVVRAPSFSKEKFSSLRISVIAGAPLPKANMLEVMSILPDLHIINLYGLSEMNPLSATVYGDSTERICESVGAVAPGVTVKIFHSKENRECKLYEAGEILARGENSFLSYYKLPAESQAIDSEGFIHTGDLGYFDDDGYLHITGRIKEIIIRGGENILPAEIVNALSEFDNIKEAMVIGMPDDFYGECVCACVSLFNRENWDEEQLNKFLKTKLAAFKIPTRYLIFDELPKLGNGKLDRETMKKELQINNAQ